MSQTNVPAVAPHSMRNLAVPVPPQLLSQLAGNFAGAYEDFGSQFRSISLKGNRFTLREAGSETTLPGNDLMTVILGMGPHNHCVYYAGAYVPGKSDSQPDAVWYQGTEPPSVVPPQALQKQANGFLGYQIRRRLVVAILQQNQSTGEYYVDLDNPYVLDAGSQSIFGEDYPAQMAFTLAGLTRFCARNRIMPLQFVTRMIFDTHKSTPALRFIPYNVNGQVQYLDEATLARVYEAAVSPSVCDLIEVRLRPDPDPAPQQVVTTSYVTPEAQHVPPVETVIGQPMAAPKVATITPPQPQPQVATITPPQPQAAPIPTPVPPMPTAVPPQPQATPTPTVVVSSEAQVKPSEMTEADDILQQAQVVAQQAREFVESEPVAAEPAQPAAQPASVATNNALSDLLARAGSYAQG